MPITKNDLPFFIKPNDIGLMLNLRTSTVHQRAVACRVLRSDEGISWYDYMQRVPLPYREVPNAAFVDYARQLKESSTYDGRSALSRRLYGWVTAGDNARRATIEDLAWDMDGLHLWEIISPDFTDFMDFHVVDNSTLIGIAERYN